MSNRIAILTKSSSIRVLVFMCGIIFLYSSVLKLIDGMEFVSTIGSIIFIGQTSKKLLIYLIPVCEFVIGSRLLFATTTRIFSDLIVLTLLTFTFSGFHLLRLLEVIKVESCGCFAIPAIDSSPIVGLFLSLSIMSVGIFAILEERGKVKYRK